ncbi:hypothetical protein A9Q84_02390 [Halobacteriovorax marinus]|uniref:Uncharacterized protein n=1 Tax=Halobacteriovorax marinus TaxID=97084 RepID=A0A1Y5FCR2_9BACT|nr:hypothetical protein A9Q84_02390 [Halobacteriovorax marinus]
MAFLFILISFELSAAQFSCTLILENEEAELVHTIFKNQIVSENAITEVNEDYSIVIKNLNNDMRLFQLLNRSQAEKYEKFEEYDAELMTHSTDDLVLISSSHVGKLACQKLE